MASCAHSCIARSDRSMATHFEGGTETCSVTSAGRFRESGGDGGVGGDGGGDGGNGGDGGVGAVAGSAGESVACVVGG